MQSDKKIISFSCDYTRGAHPDILKKLTETNMDETPGYGHDRFCEEAKEKIRAACCCNSAMVEFLVGGTQANATVIDAFLKSYQGVIAASSGHISVHEAGAVEAGGHKVIELSHENGKLSAAAIRKYLRDFYDDDTHDHMVMPGLVYISHPTEFGTLYSQKELQDIRQVCDDYGIALYLDGARLAYALACPENDVSLSDLARYCDAFYIGGTKCGALFGEAVVVPDPGRLPHFFTMIKQHGALLAKGRLLGIQFSVLFSDGLYMTIGENAIEAAGRLRTALSDMGFRLCFDSPTNQVFLIVENSRLEKLAARVEYSYFGKHDDAHTVIRVTTDWGTTKEETDALIKIFSEI